MKQNAQSDPCAFLLGSIVDKLQNSHANLRFLSYNYLVWYEYAMRDIKVSLEDMRSPCYCLLNRGVISKNHDEDNVENASMTLAVILTTVVVALVVFTTVTMMVKAATKAKAAVAVAHAQRSRRAHRS